MLVRQEAYLRAVEALLARFEQYPSGFSDDEIARIEDASTALEYPGSGAAWSGLRNEQTSTPEKVDTTPTVIYLQRRSDFRRAAIRWPLSYTKANDAVEYPKVRSRFT